MGALLGTPDFPFALRPSKAYRVKISMTRASTLRLGRSIRFPHAYIGAQAEKVTPVLCAATDQSVHTSKTTSIVRPSSLYWALRHQHSHEGKSPGWVSAHLIPKRDDALVVRQHAIIDVPKLVHRESMAKRERGRDVPLEARSSQYVRGMHDGIRQPGTRGGGTTTPGRVLQG